MEWICEQHPDKPWPHDDCAGPGMPKVEPVEPAEVKSTEEANTDAGTR